VAYSSPQSNYVLVCDVDLIGAAVGTTNIAVQLINAFTGIDIGQTLSTDFGEAGDVLKASNPSVAYHPESDEFLIVYENFNTGLNISEILFTAVSANDLTDFGVIQVSSLTTDEFFPGITVNTNNGQAFVVWNRGVPEAPLTTANPAGSSATITGIPTPIAKESSTKAGGLSGGAVAGIVIGSILGVAILAGLVFFLTKFRKNQTPLNTRKFTEMDDK